MCKMTAFLIVAMFLLSATTPAAHADGGPFGIDHVIKYDNSGIWKRSIQTDIATGTALVVIGGALWEGGEDKLGDTFWRSLDSTVLSVGTAQVMKFAFSRERPTQTSDPNKFFTGQGNQSFPSGEVAEVAGAVTPFIIAYGPDHPAVYGLALLPIYDAIARMKVHAHWQSDVLVGGLVGAGFGWYAERRDHPLILSVLPGGFMVGIHKEF
jgi:hypothetical protein